MGGPGQRVRNSSSRAWLYMKTSWAAFQRGWCQVGNQNGRSPWERQSLRFLIPREGMISHSYSVAFSVSVRLSLSHTHTKHTRTRTRARSWLVHAVSSREHGFSWQPRCPPAASGLQPNCTEEPGRSAGRLYSPPHPPPSHPCPRYQREPSIQKLFTKTHIPPACSY